MLCVGLHLENAQAAVPFKRAKFHSLYSSTSSSRSCDFSSSSDNISRRRFFLSTRPFRMSFGPEWSILFSCGSNDDVSQLMLPYGRRLAYEYQHVTDRLARHRLLSASVWGRVNATPPLIPRWPLPPKSEAFGLGKGLDLAVRITEGIVTRVGRDFLKGSGSSLELEAGPEDAPKVAHAPGQPICASAKNSPACAGMLPYAVAAG
jgi:hypothetical protein